MRPDPPDSSMSPRLNEPPGGRWDLHQQLHESPSAFEIGFSAYDPDTDRLAVPDAGANAVTELTIREEGATEVGSVPTRTKHRLSTTCGLPVQTAGGRLVLRTKTVVSDARV